MESTVLVSRNYLDGITVTGETEGEIKMLGCQNCKISSCPFLKKSKCPINVLWEASDKPEKPVFDFDQLLSGGK